MKIFANHIKQPYWRTHISTYSPSLSGNLGEHASILRSNEKTIFRYRPYFCPLCLNNYFFEIVGKVYGNAEFSIDHLPPASVGGKFKILTCKQCNNLAGQYESELLRLLEFGTIPDKYNSILPKVRVKKKGTEEAFDVSVQKKDNTVNLTFNELKKRHDEKLKSFLHDLHSGNGGPLTVTAAFPDLIKIQMALLKSAYLVCFVFWGYEFVFSRWGELIRNILTSQSEYPTAVPTFWLDKSKHHLPQGLGIVRKPEEVKCFYVNMELKNQQHDFMATVLIPNPTETGWEILENVDRFLKTHKNENLFEFFTLPVELPNNIRGYTSS